MPTGLRFDQIRLPPECEALRAEVRSFIAQEVTAGTFDPDRPDHGDSHHLAFSRRVGAKGWIGMTWPKKYGGGQRKVLQTAVGNQGIPGGNTPRSPALRPPRAMSPEPP